MHTRSALIRTILLFCIIFSNFISSYSQEGWLDTSFDTDGKLVTFIGNSFSQGQAVAIQTDGKIVVAGASIAGIGYDFALTRYNVDGSLDVTFDGDGKVTTAIGMDSDVGFALAIQPDGKLVVAGKSINDLVNADVAVIRYNTDGSLDTTFDLDGKVTTSLGNTEDEAYAMAIQNDGKIVVAGRSGNFSSSKFLLVRYNSDGSLDNSFDDDGIVTTALSANADFAFALKIQGDGKLIAAGESVGETSTLDFSLVRYNENGSLDASFGTGGMVFTDFQNSNDQIGSITIQNDGRIVAVGSTGIISEYQKTALARFNTDGSLDAAFGSQGLVTIDASTNDDFARAVAIQSNGNIVVAGEAIVGINNDFALMRFDPNGDLDLSFGDNGFVFTEFNSTLNSARAVAIQNDDKIVAAGMSHPGVADAFAVARYNNVGAIEVPEMERNNANILVYPNPCFAQSTLTSPSSLNGACLSIHNSYGQLVKQSSNLFGKSVVLTRGDLPAGIYTVNLIQANQVVSTVKWVIAD